MMGDKAINVQNSCNTQISPGVANNLNKINQKSQLFVGLKFTMRAGTMHGYIRKLVEDHAGTFSNVKDESSIVLTNSLANSSGYHTDFVCHSIEKKKILDKEKYKLPSYKVKSEDGDTKGLKLHNSRQRYTPHEDSAIHRYISKFCHPDGEWGSLGGNAIWKVMEERNVTIHSWQSMKNRYLKYIQHHPPAFHFDPLSVGMSNGNPVICLTRPAKVGEWKRNRKSKENNIAIITKECRGDRKKLDKSKVTIGGKSRLNTRNNEEYKLIDSDGEDEETKNSEKIGRKKPMKKGKKKLFTEQYYTGTPSSNSFPQTSSCNISPVSGSSCDSFTTCLSDNNIDLTVGKQNATKAFVESCINKDTLSDDDSFHSCLVEDSPVDFNTATCAEDFVNIAEVQTDAPNEESQIYHSVSQQCTGISTKKTEVRLSTCSVGLVDVMLGKKVVHDKKTTDIPRCHVTLVDVLGNKVVLNEKWIKENMTSNKQQKTMPSGCNRSHQHEVEDVTLNEQQKTMPSGCNRSCQDEVEDMFSSSADDVDSSTETSIFDNSREKAMTNEPNLYCACHENIDYTKADITLNSINEVSVDDSIWTLIANQFMIDDIALKHGISSQDVLSIISNQMEA